MYAASMPTHCELIPRLDPDTEVEVLQLTSTPLLHETVAPAAAAFTQDSTHLLYSRRFAPDLPPQYWLADLQQGQLRLLLDEAGVQAPALSPDGRYLYYLKASGRPGLWRLCLGSLQQEQVVATRFPLASCGCGAVRHDGAAFAVCGQVSDDLWAIVRFDLVHREAEVILQSPALAQATVEYAPQSSPDLLICPAGGDRTFSAGYGPGLQVIADDGTNLRQVPLGNSDLSLPRGSCHWAGKGRLATAVLHRDTPDEAFADDRLVTLALEGEDLRVMAQGRHFGGFDVSRDGRWWVAVEAPTADLWIGSVRTGRAELLVQTHACVGVPRCTNPSPLFSPDARYVAFHSNCTGVPQVYAARVEEGLLRSLEK
ncbi:oligogalacturonate lyase family protein [bacterium]|nr:oligogalacturonate lyase family protein [bacterium]